VTAMNRSLPFPIPRAAARWLQTHRRQIGGMPIHPLGYSAACLVRAAPGAKCSLQPLSHRAVERCLGQAAQ
jgi:hypothetical protein